MALQEPDVGGSLWDMTPLGIFIDQTSKLLRPAEGLLEDLLRTPDHKRFIVSVGQAMALANHIIHLPPVKEKVITLAPVVVAGFGTLIIQPEIVWQGRHGHGVRFSKEGNPSLPEIVIPMAWSGYGASYQSDLIQHLSPHANVTLLVVKDGASFNEPHNLDDHVTQHILPAFRELPDILGKPFHAVGVSQSGIPVLFSDDLLRQGREPRPMSISLVGTPIVPTLSSSLQGTIRGAFHLLDISRDPTTGRMVRSGAAQARLFQGASGFQVAEQIQNLVMHLSTGNTARAKAAARWLLAHHHHVTDMTAEMFIQTMNGIFLRATHAHGEKVINDHTLFKEAWINSLLVISGSSDAAAPQATVEAAADLYRAAGNVKKVVVQGCHSDLFHGSTVLEVATHILAHVHEAERRRAAPIPLRRRPAAA